jgi:hypothetical protein
VPPRTTSLLVVGRQVWVAGAALALVGSACSAAAAGPQPAGSTPSPIAVEVCSHKAQSQIDAVFELTSIVSTPTWSDHLYSCTLAFPQGQVRLSVKELSSWSATMAYFEGLGAQLGHKQTLYGLGQGAFLTNGGSVVVRKDWKVLLVDDSKFDVAALSRQSLGGTAAELVASVIMACWAGD